MTTQSVNIQDQTAFIKYNIDTSVTRNVQCTVQILDKNGSKIGEFHSCQNTVELNQVHFWWPYLMSENYGYLYTLVVWVQNTSDGTDVYRQKFGIREISWNSTNILVNGRPFYFRGFGKHEDSDIRGKGLDLPTVTRY